MFIQVVPQHSAELKGYELESIHANHMVGFSLPIWSVRSRKGIVLRSSMPGELGNDSTCCHYSSKWGDTKCTNVNLYQDMTKFPDRKDTGYTRVLGEAKRWTKNLPSSRARPKTDNEIRESPLEQ